MEDSQMQDETPVAPLRQREPMMPVLAFSHNWTVRLPHVYRAMRKEHVDAFFATGALRLSSFLRFRRNPDEVRGDATEGDAHLIGQYEKVTKVFIDISPPLSAWVLCGTTVYDPQYLRRFGEGCFRIHDPLGFAMAVAGEIPSFRGGFEGFCSYQAEKAVRKQLKSMAETGFTQDESGAINGFQIGPREPNLNSPDRYFLKAMKHSRESEYRWIWQAARQAGDTLDIVCPEARDFCDPIAF
jgi:hypothetical protein